MPRSAPNPELKTLLGRCLGSHKWLIIRGAALIRYLEHMITAFKPKPLTSVAQVLATFCTKLHQVQAPCSAGLP